MKQNTQQSPELITLCSCCASQFFHSGACRIRRADPNQTEKETCTYCGTRRGFDYFIYPVTGDTLSRSRRRTEKGGILCTVRTAY